MIGFSLPLSESRADIIIGNVAAKKREEYPEWINTLATPKASIARLRQMEYNDDTPDVDLKRYLRLTRRALIKENNLESTAD